MATHSGTGIDAGAALGRVAAVMVLASWFALSLANAAPTMRSAAATSAAAPALAVAALDGVVRAERLGRGVDLAPGQVLAVGDAVELGKGDHVTLALAGGGRLQVAAGARVVVETLPSAARPRAPTILNLERGRVHLNWSPSTTSPGRSVFIYTAGQRVALTGGEYFLDRGRNRVRICAAAGTAELRSVADGGHRTLVAPVCWQQDGAQPAQVAVADPTLWASLRTAFVVPATSALANVTPAATDDDGEHQPVQAEQSVAQSRPVEAARPVTRTARREVDARASEDDSAWAVNVASYTDAMAARSQSRQLQASGYGAVVVPSQIDGKTWFRVQLKGFPTSDAAQSKAALVARAMGYGKLWVVRQH